MKHKMAGIMVFLVLGCLLTGARAANEYLSLGKGSDRPIDIKAKKATARMTPDGKALTFEGNVKVNQGNVTLTCDRLVVVYNDKTGRITTEESARKLTKGLENVSQIKSITASGNVKIVQDERMAVAGKALYDNVKRTITLTEGPPRLWQGTDVMVANTIIVYLDENRVDILGRDGQDDGIKLKINPDPKKKEKLSREREN
ncbi:MAG: LptA/OstA family protein [Desulfomonilaceae bacterium]